MRTFKQLVVLVLLGAALCGCKTTGGVTAPAPDVVYPQ